MERVSGEGSIAYRRYSDLIESGIKCWGYDFVVCGVYQEMSLARERVRLFCRLVVLLCVFLYLRLSY